MGELNPTLVVFSVFGLIAIATWYLAIMTDEVPARIEEHKAFRAAMIAWLLAVTVLGMQAASAQVPERAWFYHAQATTIWTEVLGRDAPTGLLAGQIHQESAWLRDARSPYAFGLGQFTDDTAEDMARWYYDLRPADPGDPRWALRAQARYMGRLIARYPDSHEPWLFGLAGYNSGPGWTDRSIRACKTLACCDPGRWAGYVEHAHDPRHAGWAIKENRDYVVRIITIHGPVYRVQGWGPTVDIPPRWK